MRCIVNGVITDISITASILSALRRLSADIPIIKEALDYNLLAVNR
jgi:hypothetical protein